MPADVLFEVPRAYAAGVDSGSLVRFGALLKDSGTGRIVAHMQETGLVSQAVQGVASPLSMLNPLNAVSSVVANVQLAQIKAMVSALATLQFVNLGATVGGIGVSVAGFAILANRLSAVKSQLESLTAQVSAQFKEQRMAAIREHVSVTIGLCQHAQRAEVLSDTRSEYLNVARSLSVESGYFQGEIIYLLGQESIDISVLEPLVQGFALAGNARTECYMRAGELIGAQRNAAELGLEYRHMFESVTPVTLADKMGACEAGWTDSEYGKFAAIQKQAAAIVDSLRDATDVAASKPFLIQTMLDRGIAPLDFVSRVSGEKEQPILMLDAS